MLKASLRLPDSSGAPLSLRASCEPGLIHLGGECLVRLREHVIGGVDSDGAVRDRCGSRVLESALMLHLLRAEGLFAGTQRGIVTYLESRRAELGAQDGRADAVQILEAALIDTLLGGGRGDGSDVLGVFESFDHFTSARKRFMFHTLLTELGTVDSAVRFDLAGVRYDVYATWVNLEMCALRILRARQQGQPEAVTEADRAYLMDQLAHGSDRSVFEADVFAHLVALLAARRVQPDAPLIHRGIETLLRCQNPDGGFPFIAGWEPFGTAVSGLALAGAGAEREVLVCMGQFLALHQGDDGGWPYAPRVRQSDADCSPYCLEFLRAAHPVRFAPHIARAERYLLGLANPDGGFGTYRRGDDSEVGVTGSAISALTPARDACAQVLDAAVRFLLAKQRPDGTFERGWSLAEANAIFRALFALHHYPSEPPAGLRAGIDRAAALARDYLVGAQNADGGWGQRRGEPSDVLSTSYSLLALTCCGPVPPSVPRDGLTWLISQQQCDGGFTSIPDSAGPRPLPHDLPVLADAYALLALGHVLSEP
ncbi:prenyltransferase/squalene oxidase repeat-containing protein [Streptomyces sp. NPDC001157]